MVGGRCGVWRVAGFKDFPVTSLATFRNSFLLRHFISDKNRSISMMYLIVQVRQERGKMIWLEKSRW